jgi:hypothetical protein
MKTMTEKKNIKQNASKEKTIRNFIPKMEFNVHSSNLIERGYNHPVISDSEVYLRS